MGSPRGRIIAGCALTACDCSRAPPNLHLATTRMNATASHQGAQHLNFYLKVHYTSPVTSLVDNALFSTPHKLNFTPTHFQDSQQFNMTMTPANPHPHINPQTFAHKPYPKNHNKHSPAGFGRPNNVRRAAPVWQAEGDCAGTPIIPCFLLPRCLEKEPAFISEEEASVRFVYHDLHHPADQGLRRRDEFSRH